MVDWSKVIAKLSHPGAALYVFGGVGLPKRFEGTKVLPPFRPFFRFILDVELETEWSCVPVTWKKKRAYGIQWSFLFTREEIAVLILGDVKKPRCFNVPFLDRERGYEGYDKAHPAKSKFLRRANVWTDIADVDTSEPLLSLQMTDIWEHVTEILRGKEHPTQKPQRVMEIPIEAHTIPGEVVLDPFAGSGQTAMAARKLNRRWIMVEKDPVEFEKMVAGLRTASSSGLILPASKEDWED